MPDQIPAAPSTFGKAIASYTRANGVKAPFRLWKTTRANSKLVRECNALMQAAGRTQGQIAVWWTTSRPDGQTPHGLLAAGERDRVRELVAADLR